MPPRKKEASTAELRKLAQDHDIEFLGPVPPREWPSQYKHLFEKIREIRGSLFDTYGPQSRTHRSFVASQRDTVRLIRREAIKLRQNISYNESTWRELVESIVVERFKKEVLWSVLQVDM
jgi:hypothetical protein